VISGSLTQLSGPEGIAVDASGYAYVANWEDASLVVFAPGANGNEAPAREDSSGLYGPDGVAIDTRGRTYLSNGCQDDPAFVAVYAEGADGAAPLRIIEGSNTKLDGCATSVVVR
jgi:sugar lactone lactonase YvrE